MVILDEAHTLLKTQHSEVSKMLGPLRTKRRITLTGTPFVNNLRGT
jgi:SNF2 family DNA or RNA helicase